MNSLCSCCAHHPRIAMKRSNDTMRLFISSTIVITWVFIMRPPDRPSS